MLSLKIQYVWSLVLPVLGYLLTICLIYDTIRYDPPPTPYVCFACIVRAVSQIHPSIQMAREKGREAEASF